MCKYPNKHYPTTYSVHVTPFFTNPVGVHPTGLHIKPSNQFDCTHISCTYKTQPPGSSPRPSCTGLRLNIKIKTLNGNTSFQLAGIHYRTEFVGERVNVCNVCIILHLFFYVCKFIQDKPPFYRILHKTPFFETKTD